MCYSLLLSTTSETDLAARNSALVRFSRDLPAIPDVSALKHAHQWFVGSRSGCSCSFRHLYSVELGFGEPVDWYKEDRDEIEATFEVIAIIRELLGSGESVDCIDAWPRPESPVTELVELVVRLPAMADREFRFFENYHFTFAGAA